MCQKIINIVSVSKCDCFNKKKQMNQLFQQQKKLFFLTKESTVQKLYLLQVVQQFTLVHQHLLQRVVQERETAGGKQVGKVLLNGEAKQFLQGFHIVHKPTFRQNDLFDDVGAFFQFAQRDVFVHFTVHADDSPHCMVCVRLE
jgi:hypothetical protein